MMKLREICCVLLLFSAPLHAAERPNVVWIIAEDMNAWFGCYGDDTVPTPAFDGMAAEGLRFERAYMTAGVCSAARSALATGAMQTTLGIHNLRNFLTDRPFMQPQYRDGYPCLEAARRLHKEGGLNPVHAFVWTETRVPEEFYDLENDPHETRNLIEDPGFADEVARHRKILADWITQSGDQGQYPESLDSLRGVFKQWRAKAVNPEFDPLR